MLFHKHTMPYKNVSRKTHFVVAGVKHVCNKGSSTEGSTMHTTETQTQNQAWLVTCGSVTLRAYQSKQKAEAFAASWRRSGASARVVWGSWA
jgi:hypothetical protein